MTKLKPALAIGFLLAFVLPILAHSKETKPTILKSLSAPWDRAVRFIPPQQISSDKILVAVGSTLYMLNQQRETKWKFDALADINGFAYVPGLESVYIIAMDLTWIAVDAKTGIKRWSAGANGKATYAEIAAYGKDKYVVVTDRSGYDQQFMNCEEEKADGKSIDCKREYLDVVELMRDKKSVGRADFPPDAHLAVVGEQVWAVVMGKDSVTVQRVEFKNQE